MPYLGPAGTNRPWRVLVLVVIAFLLLLLAFALWSEEEDARNTLSGGSGMPISALLSG